MTASVTAAPGTGGVTALGPVRPSRLLAASAAIAVVVALLLLWVGDGRPAANLDGLPDPGPGTGWGLPVARVIGDLAAVLTVGLLLLGAVLVPARDGELRGERLRWTRAARWAGLVWAGAVMALALLTLSDVLATPVSEVLDPALLWSFLVDIDLGRALLVQALLALAVAVCAGLVTTTTGAGLVGLLAVAALVPPTLTGHAGTSTEHTVAVTSLMVHVIGISLWCGGVVALVLLGTSDRRSYPIAVPRFSAMALWCAVAVAVQRAGEQRAADRDARRARHDVVRPARGAQGPAHRRHLRVRRLAPSPPPAHAWPPSRRVCSSSASPRSRCS